MICVSFFGEAILKDTLDSVRIWYIRFLFGLEAYGHLFKGVIYVPYLSMDHTFLMHTI